MTDYVIMPKADYQGACDAIRAKTGKTDLIKSGDMATEIEEMQTGGGDDAVKYFEEQYEEVYLPTVKKLKERAFSSDKTIKRAIIPNATEIGASAFASCSNLEYVELSERLTSIPKQVFQSCSKLVLTKLPSGITSILGYAFEGCSQIALTELPSGLTSFGERAFYGCTNLALTSLPDNFTTIDAYSFYNCSRLALTELPSEITSIGDYGFYQCTDMALKSLPPHLTQIGAYAFRNCVNIELTYLPNGLTTLGQNAFNNCKKINITSIPSGVTSLGQYAFSSCTMKSITIEGGTNITGQAFSGSNNLMSVTYKGTPASITATGLSGCKNLLLIKVPWEEGTVANAPWGASNATVFYGWDENEANNRREIAFTIGLDNSSYTAREGMTWLEFVCSDYNADNSFYIGTDGGMWRRPVSGSGGVKVAWETENSPVSKLEVIEEGHHYWNGNA